MKILISGGHITPALAVAEELKKRGADVVFVGRVRTEGQISFEHELVTTAGYKHVNLNAGRFTRAFSLKSLLHLFQIPIGFVQAYVLVKKLKPDVFLSFGGYIALPLAYASKLLRIPIYTHDQVLRPGAANLRIARMAKTVFVTFEESVPFFDSKNVVVTGNPLRPEIVRHIGKKKKEHTPPLLFITGGSLGAHDLNVHIESIVDELTKEFAVVHQVGNVPAFGDYSRLRSKQSARYRVERNIPSKEMAELLHAASVVVGRSGANTVIELLALHTPSVLVPLPWSANGEQQAQAELLEKYGVAEVFDQRGGSEELLKKIRDVYKRREEIGKKFESIPEVKLDAAEVIAEYVILGQGA